MLWTSGRKFQPYPYAKETDLEKAILQVEADLFGPRRIYLDVKKKIGAAGWTNKSLEADLTISSGLRVTSGGVR